MKHPTNVSALYRKDDDAVLISTDAYVSHRKSSGPWRSTFSMRVKEAKKLRDEIDDILENRGEYR